MGETGTTVSMATYQRMPFYLYVLRMMKKEGREYASCVAISDATAINASVVKKDLAPVLTSEGKPKVGYPISELISNIEEFLGYNNTKEAIIVGVGKLGQALMGYHGFDNYGLNIIAGFDVSDDIIGKEVNGKKILPTGKLESAIEKLGIKIAILTTPAEHAQVMADALVNAGIRAIWNFAPTLISVPDNVVVKNENMAESLTILSQKLADMLKNE